jgi:hypothetical protein
MVTTDPRWLMAFFEKCQAANKAGRVLEKIAKDKKEPKEKKTAHLPVTCSRESSYWQHCCNKHDYHQSDQRNHNNLTIVIKTINATIILIVTTRTIRATSPTRRGMIASAITSRKRATRSCTMTSPPC